MKYSEQSQCELKREYRKRGEARKVLRRMQTAGNGGRGLSVYRCPWCAWYHIGHDPTSRTS